MSLRELAAIHSRLIIAKDGTPATLTTPAGVVLSSVPAIVNRSGVQIDANGLPVAGDTTSVTIDLAELAERGITDPDDLKSGVWLIASTDVTGREITGRITSPLIDRTLGRVTFFIKRAA